MPDQPAEKAEKTATITLDTANRDREFPAYQLSINVENGKSGHGYRLLGPKYVGNSKNLRTVNLTQRDADKIRAILDEVFPTEVVVDCANVEMDDGENLLALGVGNYLELDKPTAGMQPGTWRLTAYLDDGTARMRRLSNQEIQAARNAESFARMYD